MSCEEAELKPLRQTRKIFKKDKQAVYNVINDYGVMILISYIQFMSPIYPISPLVYSFLKAIKKL